MSQARSSGHGGQFFSALLTLGGQTIDISQLALARTSRAYRG
jgi:hypothetical protein